MMINTIANIKNQCVLSDKFSVSILVSANDDYSPMSSLRVCNSCS